MVTKEDYLKALEIVNEYHIHILQKAIQEDYLSKPKTRDWLNANEHLMSKRLYGSINYVVSEAEIENPDPSYLKYLYLDNLTERNCLKIPQFGKKTWNELKELLNKKL